MKKSPRSPSVELLKTALEKFESSTSQTSETLKIDLSEVNHLELMAMAACLGAFAMSYADDRERAKVIFDGLVNMLHEMNAFKRRAPLRT